ncbi:MAG: SDR family oxidoreductase [Oscillospiraceae bacterium]|nr:SDR family oxidoreductase [Oscillospiraceae bacterium]
MKKAIVTGGSRGIGSGIVLQLASEGYDIAFSYYQMEENARNLATQITDTYGVNCSFFQASLHLPGEATKLFNRCVDELGSIDLLVNNAGGSRGEGLLDLTEENLDYQINLDFRSYLIMAREASRHMIKNGIKGSIVNITSVRGERAYPGDMVYGAMKAAMDRAIQSAALDLAPYGVRVNNVAPGATRIRERGVITMSEHDSTDFWDHLGPRIPLKRAGTPDDIAQAVSFLASENASYITGVTLKVDGGITLPGMPERPESERAASQWGFKKQQYIIDNDITE